MYRVVLSLILSLFIATAHAQLGTGFTYQGRLQDGKEPATGLFDFEFRLYDTAGGGSQISNTFVLNDVPVQQGVFSVLLDFGAGIFNDNGRWLAISVRDGASSGAYDLLAPRQALTAAPYAHYALSGNPGPQGPSGVVSVSSVNGQIAPILAQGPQAPFVFAGGFATITVAAGQRVTGSGVALLGNGSSFPNNPFFFSLCFSNNSADATLNPFVGNNLTQLIGSKTTAVPASASTVFANAGTYRVGYCVKNVGVEPGGSLNSNGFVNVWFMVTD